MSGRQDALTWPLIHLAEENHTTEGAKAESVKPVCLVLSVILPHCHRQLSTVVTPLAGRNRNREQKHSETSSSCVRDTTDVCTTLTSQPQDPVGDGGGWRGGET